MTIRTSWTASGIGAFLERLLAPILLLRVYREQLVNLERLAHGKDNDLKSGVRPSG